MASEFENMRQSERNTRKQLRQERRQARISAQVEQEQLSESQTNESSYERRPKLRLIPIWARLLIIAFLLLISVTAGLMFGYGVIGDGKAIDILKTSTWSHLIDLVEKDTPKN
ncbi:DNA-directed RNA polymerase subunit beta [Calidifontibacillus oryziterrae]|uniref:DNA-directed RNA polymerase subunit beta n=1 Tax=Calidifontibacillus oryziterrae TaxID=1191699 RepID=UPI000312BE14|nr:DNA-directed RNA polymerase subunit beta [Calidifontibacillus oryziterrae]